MVAARSSADSSRPRENLDHSSLQLDSVGVPGLEHTVGDRHEGVTRGRG